MINKPDFTSVDRALGESYSPNGSSAPPPIGDTELFLAMPIRVKATREGLCGQRTACGYVICDQVSFVALPSTAALHRFVKLRNPANGRVTIAQVLDVGPWNEHDDAYVFGGSRPAAERAVSVSGKGTNGAGIDLGERVWADLAMTDNGAVDWEFVTIGDGPPRLKDLQDRP